MKATAASPTINVTW